jgi:hypothetical protein
MLEIHQSRLLLCSFVYNAKCKKISLLMKNSGEFQEVLLKYR